MKPILDAIKNDLIRLAVNDQLPMDMNELDTSLLVETRGQLISVAIKEVNEMMENGVPVLGILDHIENNINNGVALVLYPDHAYWLKDEDYWSSKIYGNSREDIVREAITWYLENI